MILKVGNEIIDLDKVPFALVFKTKEEAAAVGSIISSIKDDDTQPPMEVDGKTNGNWWFMMPVGTTKDKCDEWSTLSSDEAELLRISNRF